MVSGDNVMLRTGSNTLCNYFVIGSAKLADVQEQGWVVGCGVLFPDPGFEGLLRARLRVVFDYYKMIDNVMIFSSIWSVKVVLCSVGKDDVLFLHV